MDGSIISTLAPLKKVGCSQSELSKKLRGLLKMHKKLTYLKIAIYIKVYLVNYTKYT